MRATFSRRASATEWVSRVLPGDRFLKEKLGQERLAPSNTRLVAGVVQVVLDGVDRYPEACGDPLARIVAQWNGLIPDETSFVHLSIAEFSL